MTWSYSYNLLLENVYIFISMCSIYVKNIFTLLVQVLVTQSTEGFPEPQEIKTLGVGDYFGEKALIRFGYFLFPYFQHWFNYTKTLFLNISSSAESMLI